MANPYFLPGTQRAGQVQALFGAIARRYDLVNDLQSLGWHRHWKHRLVRRLNPAPGHLMLDLCCGTGDVAFRLQTAGARVVGVDFSLPMLRIAMKRRHPQGHAPSFLAADALQLPFADRAFDGLTLSYGLRNLADFSAAMAEFARVLKPGGRIGILDFGKPTHPLWRKLYFAYLQMVVPVLGRVCCGDAAAYAYILESLRHYPDPAGVTRLLLNHGWTEVELDPLLGGIMSLHLATRSNR